MDKKDGVLSQEEINALLGMEDDGNNDLEENEMYKDIIGEIGNIFMSTAATTLSKLLNKKVDITAPEVEWIKVEDIIEGIKTDTVVTTIEFEDGVKGENLLIMDIEDGLIIADLMMGGEGDDIGDKFSELELSALAEAMNQMIGSASTSMSKMLKKEVDISPPEVEILKKGELNSSNFKTDETTCKVSFDLDVEGLIKSEIMQIYSREMVEEIVEIVMAETSDISNKKKEDKDLVEDKELASEEVVIAPQDNDREVDIVKEEKEKAQDSYSEEKVKIQKPVFSELEPEGEPLKKPRNLDLIMDVPLEFSVVLGKSQRTIQEILSYTTGSIVELDKLADEPLEIYVNGKLIASGEVVVINENFGIRITNILTREERVQNLG